MSPAPRPTTTSAAPSTVGGPAAYKSVTINAPTAVPTAAATQLRAVDASKTSAYGKTPTYTGTPATPLADPPRAPAPAPVAGARPGTAKSLVAGAAVAGVVAAGVSGGGTKPAKPAVSTSGFAPETAARLAPQVSRFEDRYRDVHVVREPTTSGWTWLFLAWALSNSSANSRLEADNRAMRDRMAALEQELRTDPQQWQELQALSSADTRPSVAEPAQDAASEALAMQKATPTDVVAEPAVSVNPPASDSPIGTLLWGGALLALGLGVVAVARR